MTGDPAEPDNLSVSVDWKLMKKQRKIKMRDLRDTINQGIADKFKEINNRGNLVNAHQGNLKKTMIGVLPEDVTKKDFETLSSGEMSGQRPDKPHSYHDAGE